MARTASSMSTKREISGVSVCRYILDKSFQLQNAICDLVFEKFLRCFIASFEVPNNLFYFILSIVGCIDSRELLIVNFNVCT